MSEAINTKMPGPGPSAMYQTEETPRARRGLTDIHQSGLTSAIRKDILQDPFNMLPHRRLLKTILQLACNPAATGKVAGRLKFGTTNSMYHSQLSSWIREPAFNRIILDAFKKNPVEFSGVGNALVLDHPSLFLSEKAAAPCRLLVDRVYPEIQEKIDYNFLCFCCFLFNQLSSSKNYENIRFSGGITRWSAPLHYQQRGLSEQAKAYRNWMKENQEILNGIETLDLRKVGLEVIPPELFMCANVTSLNLSGYNEVRLPLSTALTAFRSLRKLENLVLNQGNGDTITHLLGRDQSGDLIEISNNSIHGPAVR